MLDGLLIIGPLPPPKGGVSIHVSRLASALAARGARCSLLDESRQPTDGVANLRQISLLQYWRLIRSARLVHVHSSNPFIRLGHILIARLQGRRVVQTVHSLVGWRTEPVVLRLSGLLSHQSIGVNADVAGAIGASARVIPAFIAPDPAEEVGAAEFAEWIAAQRAQGRSIIAMNAFRASIKGGHDLYGLDMIVAAFQDERIRRDFAVVACVSTTQGCEKYHAEIEQQVAALRLGSQFKFILGQSNFPAILKQCDLFVRPTTSDGDAISLREALWYGKPAIASDAVARPPGTILFPSRNVDQFIARILDARTADASHKQQSDFSDAVIEVYRSAGRPA